MGDSATTGFLLRNNESNRPPPSSRLTALFVLKTNLTIYKEDSESGERGFLAPILLPLLHHRLINYRNLRL